MHPPVPGSGVPSVMHPFLGGRCGLFAAPCVVVFHCGAPFPFWCCSDGAFATVLPVGSGSGFSAVRAKIWGVSKRSIKERGQGYLNCQACLGWEKVIESQLPTSQLGPARGFPQLYTTPSPRLSAQWQLKHCTTFLPWSCGGPLRLCGPWAAGVKGTSRTAMRMPDPSSAPSTGGHCGSPLSPPSPRLYVSETLNVGENK